MFVIVPWQCASINHFLFAICNSNIKKTLFSRRFIFLLLLILFLQMHLFRYTEFLKTTLATFAICVQIKGPVTCLYMTPQNPPGAWSCLPLCPVVPLPLHHILEARKGRVSGCAAAVLCQVSTRCSQN